MFRQSPPQVPMALMFGGVIPFASSAGAMIVWRENLALLNLAALWLLVYSAVILSFLGGVRWGAEIAKRERPRFAELGPSVLGALTGWGLVMAGFQHGMQTWLFAAMGAALTLHYFYDAISPELPLWYRRMRVWPTLGAVLSLAAAYLLLTQQG
ncbi:MAG: DUF3429 domain-containing protein [Pseudomonadota bacterium]